MPFRAGARRIDVTVDEAFPFTPPRLVLVDRPPFLTWPHVERDGGLCLYTETATFSPYAPVDVVVNLLDFARDVIERGEGGEADDDFRDEVLSYWKGGYDGPPILSLVDADGPTRVVTVWRGSRFVLIGDGVAQVHRWLATRFGLLTKRLRQTETGAFVRLGRAPLPGGYPGTAASLYDMASAMNGADALLASLRDVPAKLVVALAMDTVHGSALAAAVVDRPAVRRGKDPLTAGFAGRPVPRDVLARRFFGDAPVDRTVVERVEPNWVHGRCHDVRFEALSRAKVVVLGCGSIGAPVAVALAQAGVGHFVLVDRDALCGANLGRHPLGAASLRMPKAEALRDKIVKDLPHVRVEARHGRAEEVILGPASAFDGVTLVVSALGNWSTERLLDDWHEADGRRFPVVYCSTEPRASAGHAVAVVGEGSSLQDGFSAAGLPFLQVTCWPDGSTRRQEPACGAVYEPYGPVELGYVTTMAADLALDCVLGDAASSTHRIWACGRRFLARAGGAWSAEWRAAPGFQEEGAYVSERPWGAQGARSA